MWFIGCSARWETECANQLVWLSVLFSYSFLDANIGLRVTLVVVFTCLLAILARCYARVRFGYWSGLVY